MHPRAGTTRPPLWMVAILLFVAVWLSARILHNITDALTGMTAGPQVVAGVPTWPVRTAGDVPTP